jgi:hypothetical protein
VSRPERYQWSALGKRGEFPTPEAVAFVPPRELLHLALEAHRAAVRDQRPPPGEPWISPEGDSWSAPEVFHECLMRQIELRLMRRAALLGYAEKPEPEPESPEAMGHGWPALDVAAGSGHAVDGACEGRMGVGS